MYSSNTMQSSTAYDLPLYTTSHITSSNVPYTTTSHHLSTSAVIPPSTNTYERYSAHNVGATDFNDFYRYDPNTHGSRTVVVSSEAPKKSAVVTTKHDIYSTSPHHYDVVHREVPPPVVHHVHHEVQPQVIHHDYEEPEELEEPEIKYDFNNDDLLDLMAHENAHIKTQPVVQPAIVKTIIERPSAPERVSHHDIIYSNDPNESQKKSYRKQLIQNNYEYEEVEDTKLDFCGLCVSKRVKKVK